MKKNARGFTIIEIMVALFIFSIVLLPLTSLLVADSKFQKKYEQKQLALIIAKNELEKAKRTWRKAENNEYQVTMAGRKWNIGIVVENGEIAALPGTTGAPHMPWTPLTTAPAPGAVAIVKQFVTVRVSRDIDSTVLATLRVLKETYR